MRVEYNLNGITSATDFSKRCIDDMCDFLVNKVPNSLFKSLVTPTSYTPSVTGELSADSFGISYYYAVVETSFATPNSFGMNNLFIILFGYSGNVSVFVSTAYNPNREPWEQEDVIVNSFKSYYVGEYLTWFAHYLPAPTFHFSGHSSLTLVANYNNGIVMFSCIENKIQDGQNKYAVEKTSNIIIGNSITKFGDYSGGFFYGGDHIYTLEFLYDYSIVYSGSGSNRVPIRFVSQLMVLPDSNFSRLDWHIKAWNPYRLTVPSMVLLSNPYSDAENLMFSTKMPNTSNLCRLHLFLYAHIDNAPYRTIIKSPSSPTNFGAYQVYQYKQRAVWASTLDFGVYVPMQISISDQSSGVPTYKPLFTSGIVDAGHTANTLNNVSLILELYLMCRRDPWSIGDYSCVGRTDIINYVNMLNMDTDAMEEGDFPTNQGKFNCFLMGTRRNKFGAKGYNGLAFKQEE